MSRILLLALYTALTLGICTPPMRGDKKYIAINYVDCEYGYIFDNYVDEIMQGYIPYSAENPITIINHKLMYLIYKTVNSTKSFDDEWLALRGGFVDADIVNITEDMALFFGELITYECSKVLFKQYDDIITSKFRILYKILVAFDPAFKEIIKEKIETPFKMAPSIYHKDIRVNTLPSFSKWDDVTVFQKISHYTFQLILAFYVLRTVYLLLFSL